MAQLAGPDPASVPAPGPWQSFEKTKVPGAGIILLNSAALPKAAPGICLSVFATHFPGARVLALDPEGTLLVSLTSQGQVVALPDKNGTAWPMRW